MMHASPSRVAAGAHLLALAAAQPLPSGLIVPSIKADASNPTQLLADLQKAFTDFKAENDRVLATKSSKADVLADEKITRMSDAIGGMQAEFDKLTASIEALKIGAGNDKELGDLPKTDPEYLKAFKSWMRQGQKAEADLDAARVKNAMTKDPDTNGGYLAPVEWDRTIINRLKQISAIRAHARVQSISVAGFKKVFNDRNVGSGWVGETAARPATTTPALGILDFTPGELYANPAISQQLLDDAAVNLESWLSDEVDTEFARQEGIAFLSGNGANKPYGVLTYVEGGANAARHPYGAIKTGASGNANLITADGVIDLMYSLEAQYAANAKFFINRLTLGQVRKLKDGQGNYLWEPSYQAGQPQTILGAPIVEVPDMPIVAAGNIVALYGDMGSTYLVIDRIGISVLRDPFTNKPYVHFYTVKRVGGGVFDPQPMRALKIGA